MDDRFLPAKFDWRERFQRARASTTRNFKKHWYKLFLLVLFGFLLQHKDLSINFHLNGGQLTAEREGYEPENIGIAQPSPTMNQARPLNTSLVTPQTNVATANQKPDRAEQQNLANTFSNLQFNAEDERLRAQKRKKQLAYVKKYVKTARSEMDKYGIPASITLAQGLLESNVGESRLARKNNNHFGIKCFSKSCKKGHCSNFTDDHHKDFFRNYKSAWESYRAHSLLLKKNKRYKSLFKLSPEDYSSWAHGLKSAGYATDKHYAYKIINLIEDLELYEYDE